ncbi:fused MFS/spermidine synthase [Glutamicibacter sp. MNS18]|uniref:spermidine synthase n=1 Tax=Glutamicibacter sp. MNS18 TaxID=2989817 RepID=UPI0022357B3D|nr:fused MFS/spermidine synthase [Glutamicibacter sp. MNS18]MCW4466196.1 fused MFS/spermidine synthase [Glutamicibacter sp. MNS18]
MATTAQRWLGGIQAHAVIEDDMFIEGAKILSIGGAEQSHVNIANQGQVFYEYLARIANHLAVLHPRHEPLRFLHLGAGALTLARWAQVKYPGSEQVAVDIERELMDFVLENLPLPAGTRLRPIVADARTVLEDQLSDQQFDAIILDIFTGDDAPEHLTTPDYYALLASRLTPKGTLFVNVGDDPPLRFTDRQVDAAREHFAFVALSAPPEMFSRKFPGNLVLTATNALIEPELVAACQTAGPHPSEVRAGLDLDGFGKP